MEALKACFITSNSKAYKEGEVNIFSQALELKKGIKKAILYATALGIYEAEINGKRIGEQIFAPGFTYYHRDLFYQKYDISKQLVPKESNNLRFYLAQGWYSGRFTHENLTQIYGEKTAVSWILEIETEDGVIERITSSTNVKELSSQYKYAGFYDGEVYDDTAEEAFIGYAQKYSGKIPENIEENYIVVKLQEEMPVKKIIKKENRTILNFGQNFAGIVTMDTSFLQNGATVKIRHAEMLTEDKELYTANLRKAKAEIIYFKGADDKIYRPRFTYMGFRYIEITGAGYVDGFLRAFAVYSDMKRTGDFCTSHEKVQRLYYNQLWGQKSNYVEVPTDCPQRDERQGYTGDGQVFALTGSYNFDTELFWKKFLKDMHYSQLDNSEGYIGATIPANGPAGIGFLSMLGWGNAITILPELLYRQYGTSYYLKKYYPNMKKFIDAEISRLGEDNLSLLPNLGDWLMPGKDMNFMAAHHGPVSNSFIIHDLEIIISLAESFGYEADKIKYGKHLEKIRKSYLETYIKEDGTIFGDYQGAYIMALKYVLSESEIKEKVFMRFVENVKAEGLNTGFFSTEFLLPLLAEGGEAALAFDILLSEDCPGWLYQVNQGATTIWERWNALKEDGTVNEEGVGKESGNMVSFNHYAFGSVGEFYYQYILGIKPIEPGYTKIQIRPYVDQRLKDVSGTYYSRQGEISSSWRFLKETIEFEFKTPAKTTIILPNGDNYQVEPGSYSYKIERKGLRQ